MAEPVEDKPRPVSNRPERIWSGRVLLDALAEVILSITIFVWRFVWWSCRWSVACVLIVAMMGAAGWYVYSEVMAGGRYVTVPNIVNMAYTDGVQVLGEAGLEMGPQTETESEQVPRYHVISQSPAAGKVVREGRRIYPIVSSGRNLEEAPSFLYVTLTEAREALSQHRFREGVLSRIPHTAQADTIIAQEPAIGQPIERGGSVNFLVSSGSGDVSSRYMPNLVGKSLREVAQTLSRLGLTGFPVKETRSDAPFDEVLDQDPTPGTLISAGQVISYKVRASDPEILKTLWREVRVKYIVPNDAYLPHVRADIVTKQGERWSVWDQPVDAGVAITIPVTFLDEVTVEFFVNGEKDTSYYYEGDAEPIVSRHRTEAETERADT